MQQTIRTMLTSWRCLLTAVVVSWAALTLALFIPNWDFLRFGLTVGGFDGLEKLQFIYHFYWTLGSNFTPLSAVLTVLISVLFGLQMAALLFYIKSMRHEGRIVRTSGALSVGGFVSGLFGIGCSACGSVIITGVLSTVGASGLLTLLPLGGEEFSLIAVGLLSYSLYYLIRATSRGKVCVVF